MARDRDRDRDDEKESRQRGRDRDPDRDDARRSYGKISKTLMEIYKHDSVQAKSRSGGGSKRDWYGLNKGLNLCRFLPALEPDRPFYVYVLQHYGVGPDGKSFVYCPKTFDKDADCPICDYVDLTIKQSKNKKEIAAATEMKASGRWIAQVLDMDEKDDIVKLFGFPVTIYNGVMELITGKYPDLLEFENGYDVNIKKDEGKQGVRYPSIYPEKEPSSVNPDVVDSMIDVEEYVKKRIFSGEELTKILDGEDPMDIVNERDGSSRSGTREKRSSRDDDRPSRGRGRDRDDDDRDRGRGRERDDDDRSTQSRGRDDDDRGRGRDRDEEDDRRGRERDTERSRGRDERDDRSDRGRGRDRDDNRDDDRSSRDRDTRSSDRSRGRDRDDDDRGRDRDREDRGRSRDDRDEDRSRSRGRDADPDDEVAEEMERLKRESGAGSGRGRR